MDNNDKVNPEELAKALESIFGNMLESDKKKQRIYQYSLKERIPPLLKWGMNALKLSYFYTNHVLFNWHIDYNII